MSINALSIMGLLLFAMYFLWLSSLIKISYTVTESFAADPDVAPQCMRWYVKKSFWKWPPFSWFDSVFTYTTELVLAVIWFIQYQLK